MCPAYRESAAAKAKGAIEKREREKLAKYDAQIRENHLLFLPLVVEILGGWNARGLVLLEELAGRYAEQHFIEKKVALRRFMTGLSIRLQKLNARMLISRMFLPLH